MRHHPRRISCEVAATELRCCDGARSRGCAALREMIAIEGDLPTRARATAGAILRAKRPLPEPCAIRVRTSRGRFYCPGVPIPSPVAQSAFATRVVTLWLAEAPASSTCSRAGARVNRHIGSRAMQPLAADEIVPPAFQRSFRRRVQTCWFKRLQRYLVMNEVAH